MTPLDLALGLGIIAGAITSLAIIWTKFLRPIGRGVRKAVEVYEIIVNFPVWQSRVDQCINELQPNNGRSIKDRVDALHRDYPQLRLMLEEHIRNTTLHQS